MLTLLFWRKGNEVSVISDELRPKDKLTGTERLLLCLQVLPFIMLGRGQRAIATTLLLSIITSDSNA